MCIKSTPTLMCYYTKHSLERCHIVAMCPSFPEKEAHAKHRKAKRVFIEKLVSETGCSHDALIAEIRKL